MSLFVNIDIYQDLQGHVLSELGGPTQYEHFGKKNL